MQSDRVLDNVIQDVQYLTMYLGLGLFLQSAQPSDSWQQILVYTYFCASYPYLKKTHLFFFCNSSERPDEKRHQKEKVINHVNKTLMEKDRLQDAEVAFALAFQCSTSVLAIAFTYILNYYTCNIESQLLAKLIQPTIELILVLSKKNKNKNKNLYKKRKKEGYSTKNVLESMILNSSIQVNKTNKQTEIKQTDFSFMHLTRCKETKLMVLLLGQFR